KSDPVGLAGEHPMEKSSEARNAGLRVRQLWRLLPDLSHLRRQARRPARAAHPRRRPPTCPLAHDARLGLPAVSAAVPRSVLLPRWRQPLHNLFDPAGCLPALRAGKRAMPGSSEAVRAAAAGFRGEPAVLSTQCSVLRTVFRLLPLFFAIPATLQ